jgi:hypothetical protein
VEVVLKKMLIIRFKLGRQKYIPLEARKGVGKTLLTTFPFLRMMNSV